MVNSPSFWMVVALTISIIISWLTLRKIPVKSEVLSDHAVRIHFDYAHPVPGSFARFSSDPLFEWHSFATISIPEEKGFSVIVSRAGDWTSKVIANPPTSLWVRGVPTCGALRVVPLFRRIILVCTGSGIGPIAPHLFRPGRAPMILLWVSRDVRKTFGDKFVDAVLRASPDAIIYDTRKHGKPDMVKLAYRMYKDFDAEAVAVLSNQRLTEKVVYGLLSRGVPAFGPIFDS
ncbi:uncharacterized protein EI90DRAFT_3034916 [Cantharellus anzutake]|uniref:uncharacterized protein n=1 Tax=Cantharellus anzutake TaxID=1750568 RepID=UPI001902F5FE|nr:uncharacterized protein EI90DRAFT_3034916 [Cantharellus anzutake]KAF8340265.1 hypothetical protein EI90DRAFT_3034916 [Cantharellus anzutake]